MPTVDYIAGIRDAYQNLASANSILAARRERRRLQDKAAQAARGTALISLAGTAIGGAVGGPAGAAAGGSIGALAGRGIYGQDISPSDVANTGAAAVGAYDRQEAGQQNQNLNELQTRQALQEQQAQLPPNMTPENVQTLQATQRLRDLMVPDQSPQPTFDGSGPYRADLLPVESPGAPQIPLRRSESGDQRLDALLGQPQGEAPTEAQQKTLDRIAAIQRLQGGGLSHVDPRTLAGVLEGFRSAKQEYQVVPEGSRFVKIGPSGITEVLPATKQPKTEQTFEARDSKGNVLNGATGVSLEEARAAIQNVPNAKIYKTSIEPTDRASTAGTEFERIRPRMEEYNAKVAAGEQVSAKEHSDYALNYSKYSRPEMGVDATGAKFIVREGLNFQDLGYVNPPNMQEVYKRERANAGQAQEKPVAQEDVPRVSPGTLNEPKLTQPGIASSDAKKTAAASLAIGKSLDVINNNLRVFGDAPLSNIDRRLGRWVGQDKAAIEVKNALDSIVNDFTQAAAGTQTEGDVTRFKALTGDLSTPLKEVKVAADKLAQKLAIQSNAAFADAIEENRKPSYAQKQAVQKFSEFEPISVTSKKLYDALPAGTWYVDGYGKRGRKQ